MILPLATAQDTSVSAEDLPEAGTTPDSIFWGIDRALENIDLALTFDKSAKAQKGLEHAAERLLEVKAMIEKNKLDHAEKAELAHKRKLEKVRIDIASLAEEEEEDLTKVVEFENSLEEQEDVLSKIRARVRIKIEGELTDEQRLRLFAFLNSLDENIGRVRIDIENKEERTLTRIEQRTGKSKTEIRDKFSRSKEEKRVKAKIFLEEDFSLVKVEYKFEYRSKEEITNKKAMIRRIIERFATSKEEANRLLKMERVDENGKDREEVEIWHVPPGNPEESHKIIIGAPAVSAHLSHGDSLGRCDNGSDNSITEQDEDDKERLRIKVEIRENRVKVRIELRFIDGTDRDSIIEEIVKRTQLTPEQIREALEIRHKEKEFDGKRRIKVEVIHNKDQTEVEIEWNGEKREFDLKVTDKAAIIKEIAIRLGVPEEEVEAVLELKVKENGNDDEDDNDNGDEDDEDDKIITRATRSISARLDIYDISSEISAWSGSLRLTRSNENEYEKPSGLAQLVQAVAGEPQSDAERFPFPDPPTTEQVLEVVFRGFAVNMPEED